MSPVATRPKPADTQASTPRDQRVWSRTPEQETIIREHLAMVSRHYVNADPLLRSALQDETILGTDELSKFLGVGANRIHQLRMKTGDLTKDGQVPHPSAIPEVDATAGMRGPYAVGGLTRGRAVLWAMQSGRMRWDPETRTLVPQLEINHGGAPKRSPRQT